MRLIRINNNHNQMHNQTTTRTEFLFEAKHPYEALCPSIGCFHALIGAIYSCCVLRIFFRFEPLFISSINTCPFICRRSSVLLSQPYYSLYICMCTNIFIFSFTLHKCIPNRRRLADLKCILSM